MASTPGVTKVQKWPIFIALCRQVMRPVRNKAASSLLNLHQPHVFIHSRAASVHRCHAQEVRTSADIPSSADEDLIPGVILHARLFAIYANNRGILRQC